MIKSRAKAAVKAMAHQALSLKHDEANELVLDLSDPGCVSADTEYLTPTGWKRIDQYKDGPVAQFHPDDRNISFVEPLGYIKKPCDQMIAIAPARGTSQRLSPEHRVLFYRADGSHDVCSAAEYMEALHQKGPSHLDRKFCSTFTVRGKSGVALSDAEIRVMVAVVADGHFQNDGHRCVVRVKKIDKVLRLSALLDCANIKYSLRSCGGADPEFRVFTFSAPSHHKLFTGYWWDATQEQLCVIASELPYWDSSIDARPSAGVRFSSFDAESADFAQYAFAAAKQPASKTCSIRDRSAEGRGVMIEYVVHAQASDKFVGPGRKDSVSVVANPEGFKYCFEVPTSFLLLRHNGYIFATGNTGKTFVRILGFAKRRAKKKHYGCALVLAPRSLLRATWQHDLNKFAPHLKVAVATAANRDKAFAEDADIYVTNHDAVNWLAKQKPAFFAKFSELVVDESPAYKHHTSQRSRAALKISKHFEQRKLMTATPTSNGICDIWHQVMLLDHGKRLGNSFYGFRNSVCEPKQVGRDAHAIKWTDKTGAEEAVFSLISDITIRHEFEKCVDIPKTHTHTLPYHMTPKQQRMYDDMEQDQLLPLLTSGNAVYAVHAASVATKLLQIASGAVYDAAGNYAVLDESRYEMLIDLAEARKHPFMLFFWRHQRDLLLKHANARKMRVAVIDGDTGDDERYAINLQYQRGELDLLLGHPQSVAHGLTFTRGTSTIWAGPTYNLEWFKQGSRRQARIGQTERTEVLTVIAQGTREEEVYDWALMPKNRRMSRFLEMFELSTAEAA